MAFLRNFAKSVGPVKPATEACEAGGIVRPRGGDFWRRSELRRLPSPPCILVRSTMERTSLVRVTDWLTDWLVNPCERKERARKMWCVQKNGGIQSCPESSQSLWLRYDSWAPGFVRKRSTVDSGGEPRPAKTCQKIPKKRPLSAESYRRQDWRKYADSRGDPNRSSVAETKTRMSKILSELTSQRVMFQKW